MPHCLRLAAAARGELVGVKPRVRAVRLKPEEAPGRPGSLVSKQASADFLQAEKLQPGAGEPEWNEARKTAQHLGLQPQGTAAHIVEDGVGKDVGARDVEQVGNGVNDLRRQYLGSVLK